MRPIGYLVVLSALGWTMGADGAEVLPDPKTGGAGGGPITLLFLGAEPQLDKTYEQDLTQEGFVCAAASFFQPYKQDFFRKFNVIVLDSLPPAAAEWETFGQKMLYYWKNIERVEQCLREGAGVLVYAYSAGGNGYGGWNQEMKRWGVQIMRSSVRDRERAFGKWVAYGDNFYCWTENIMPHPITAGLKRIYYPSANLRWDEFYTAPPLILEKEWTPIVRAMAGSHAERAAGDRWSIDPDGPADLVLAAVRTLDKGRFGVISCDPGYIHWFPYSSKSNAGELSYADAAGIAGRILRKGDGNVPSDTGALVSRMYRWLADESAAKGFGGFKPADLTELQEPLVLSEEEKKFTPVIDWDNPPAPPSWRHRAACIQWKYFPEVTDPLVTGEVKFFKALVGVHSSSSDGKGTVKEYAEAARKAGYSLVCFAEAFEALSKDAWKKLAAECEANTTEDLACLPGYDIMDRDGNHLIVIGAPEYPHVSWLTPDGKRIEQVQMLNLGYYNHKVVAHKPCSSTVLPFERLKHFQGLSVYTYRGGKLVDDSMKAYAWETMNSSSPQPIVVHEVFSPAEVEEAARTGFQQIMPADTVRNAVSYFRVGIVTFFEAPARYMISEGPIIHRWVVAGCKDTGPAEENRQQFRVLVGGKSDVPLKSVTLYDGFAPVRCWRPTRNDFEAAADFRHSHQYGLYLVVEDSKGRRAISSPLRTVPERFHFRCSDRQNWLGHTGFHYTGTWLPEGLNIFMPVRGTDEASAILTGTRGTCMAVKLNFPFASNDVILTEALMEDVYTYALWEDIGFDAKPSRASKPSTVYSGRLRHWNFTPVTPLTADKACVTLIEIELKLKRDVEPVEGKTLWPAFGGLREKKFCRLGPDGKLVSGEVKEDMDVPPGTLVGGYIALSPGLRVEKGTFGLVAPKRTAPTIPAGTTFNARFLLAAPFRSYAVQRKNWFDENPEAWLRAMGFAGPTPYQITLNRGKLDKIAFFAEVTPDRAGVAGEVAVPAQIPYWVPIRIPGMNPNWAAGIWQEGQIIRYTGVFENTAWPRLDVSRKGRFYAGNLLTADKPEIVLTPIIWTKDRIKVEVHNPTPTALKATISSPKEIAGLKRLKEKVSVPPGSTVYVEEPAPKKTK